VTAVTADRTVAGLRARLTIDRSIPSRLTAPLIDLASWEGPYVPDLTIGLRPFDDETDRSPVTENLQPSGSLRSSDDGRSVHHRQPHCVATLDRVSCSIQASIRAGAQSTFTARPLHTLLSIVCADRGIDLVHAALVSLDGRGILIAGPGGSGKSTTALAAMLDGWDYLGDDCAAIAPGGDTFIGSSVYASGCVEPGHLARFAPQLAVDHAAPDDKALVPLPARVAQTSTSIRAIVLPRVTGGEDVVLTRLDAKTALLALAPTSILRRAVPAAATLARLRALVTSCPCYLLEMGPTDRIARRLRQILAD